MSGKNARRRRRKKKNRETLTGVVTPPPKPLLLSQPTSVSTIRQRFQLLKSLSQGASHGSQAGV